MAAEGTFKGKTGIESTYDVIGSGENKRHNISMYGESWSLTDAEYNAYQARKGSRTAESKEQDLSDQVKQLLDFEAEADKYIKMQADIDKAEDLEITKELFAAGERERNERDLQHILDLIDQYQDIDVSKFADLMGGINPMDLIAGVGASGLAGKALLAKGAMNPAIAGAAALGLGAHAIGSARKDVQTARETADGALRQMRLITRELDNGRIDAESAAMSIAYQKRLIAESKSVLKYYTSTDVGRFITGGQNTMAHIYHIEEQMPIWNNRVRQAIIQPVAGREYGE